MRFRKSVVRQLALGVPFAAAILALGACNALFGIQEHLQGVDADARADGLAEVDAQVEGDAQVEPDVRVETDAQTDAETTKPCIPSYTAKAGTLDPDFHSGLTKVPSNGNFETSGILLDGHGNIYVFGWGQVGQSSDFVVMRFDNDGALDSSYGGGTGFAHIDLGASEAATAAAFDDQGRLVVVGMAGRADDDGSVGVARFTTEGLPDATFNPSDAGRPGGVTFTPPGAPASGYAYTAYGVAIDGQDIVVAGADGNLWWIGSSGFVLRLHSDGSLEPSFHTHYDTTVTGYYGLVKANGALFVSAAPISGNEFAVQKMALDGTVDETFGTHGRAHVAVTQSFTPRPRTLFVEPGGAIVVAGAIEPTFPDHTAVVRFTPAGLPDVAGFSGGTYRSLDLPWQGEYNHNLLTSQCDGKILVGGTSLGALAAAKLQRLLPTGTLDPTYGTAGTASGPTGTTVGSGGGVVVDPRTGKAILAARDGNRVGPMLYRFFP
jgi:uncharacterized delta-60 repeat protein